MGSRITSSQAGASINGFNDNLQSPNRSSTPLDAPSVSLTLAPGADSKLFEANNNAQLLRRQVAAKYVQITTNAPNAAKNAGLEQRADELAKVLAGGGKRTFAAVAPHISNLSIADAKQLRQIYQQKTGRDLLRDTANYLFMEDRFRAFRLLAPERIHEQTESFAAGTGGSGIKMNPPTREVLEGSQVEYTLDLLGEIGGNRHVTHLVRRDNADVEEAGASFTADYGNDGYQKDRDYRVTFEVRYGDGLPEFYTSKVTVRDADSKAANELSALPGTAPDSELYLQYLDGQISDVKTAIGELETKRDSLYADIRNSAGNSADHYTQVRGVEKQLAALKAKLPEMEIARTEVSTAFAGSQEKLIPLKAALIAKENGRTIPLQLYAKNLGAGKWAIVDVTNPAKPRT